MPRNCVLYQKTSNPVNLVLVRLGNPTLCVNLAVPNPVGAVTNRTGTYGINAL